jgi:transposase-like protein
MRELLEDSNYEAETVSLELSFDQIVCPHCGVDSDSEEVSGELEGTVEDGTVYGFFNWNCGFCSNDVSKLMTYEMPFDEDDRD